MRTALPVVLAALLAAGCASPPTPLQMQALEERVIADAEFDHVFRATRTVFQNYGYMVLNSEVASGFLLFSIDTPEKNPRTALMLGLVPGAARSYVRSYGGAVLDVFTYPFSILWAGPLAASKAARMERTITVSVTMVERGPDVQVRIGFRNAKVSMEQYGLFLRRLFAEIERKTRMERAYGEFADSPMP